MPDGTVARDTEVLLTPLSEIDVFLEAEAEVKGCFFHYSQAVQRNLGSFCVACAVSQSRLEQLSYKFAADWRRPRGATGRGAAPTMRRPEHIQNDRILQMAKDSLQQWIDTHSG